MADKTRSIHGTITSDEFILMDENQHKIVIFDLRTGKTQFAKDYNPAPAATALWNFIGMRNPLYMDVAELEYELELAERENDYLKVENTDLHVKVDSSFDYDLLKKQLKQSLTDLQMSEDQVNLLTSHKDDAQNELKKAWLELDQAKKEYTKRTEVLSKEIKTLKKKLNY